LGGGRLGIASGEDVGGRHRRSVRPGRPHQGHPEVFVVGAARLIKNRVRNGTEPIVLGPSESRPPWTVALRRPQRARCEALWLNRVARLARRAHHCHDGVQEPIHGSQPLVPVLRSTGCLERAIVVDLDQLLVHDSGLYGGRVENDVLARQRGSVREPTAFHPDG
jgi:hypothetical protein